MSWDTSIQLFISQGKKTRNIFFFHFTSFELVFIQIKQGTKISKIISHIKTDIDEIFNLSVNKHIKVQVFLRIPEGQNETEIYWHKQLDCLGIMGITGLPGWYMKAVYGDWLYK